MKMLFISSLMIIFMATSTVINLHAQSSPREVMKKYERLVKDLKADSISQLFTLDAEIGHEGQAPVKGRDSISRFLSSFKNIQVLSNVDSVTNMEIGKDSAIIQGIYKQSVIIAGKDTVNVAGHFLSKMVEDKNRNWLIYSMHTRPL